MKKARKRKLMHGYLALAILSTFYFNAQNYFKCYGSNTPQLQLNSAAFTCPNNNSFNSTTDKYSTQEYYRDLVGSNTFITNPNAILFPELTVRVSLHIAIRTTADPTLAVNYLYGPATNLANALSNPSASDPYITAVTNSIENYLWYSNSRKCSQADNFVVPSLYRTQIKFKVVGVHFYHNDNLVGVGGMAAMYNQAMAFSSEGLPVIFSFGEGSCYIGGPQYENRPAIFVGAPIDVPAGPGDFLTGHLRHEIGHAFGLYHTYYGGVATVSSGCSCYTPSNTACLPNFSPEATDPRTGS